MILIMKLLILRRNNKLQTAGYFLDISNTEIDQTNLLDQQDYNYYRLLLIKVKSGILWKS